VPCVAIDRAAFNQGINAMYDIGIDENGVAFTCVAKGPGAVAYEKPVICVQGNIADRAESVNCNGSGWSEDKAYTLNTVDKHVVVYGEPQYIVRRLTPLECERLQGYPDYWTDIGEYTDTNGKKKKSSDAARYKALGNSIALPPWKWVLKRLCSHYERDATLLSLFDGIGGFPLIWEGLNGKGTCLFASEIEEFPIAVTKARIG
jgi:site-specific DNA-cytosine methylase